MRYFYFLLICWACYSTSLSAQEEVLNPPLPTEMQPFNYNYPKASKVHCKRYNHFEILQEWDRNFDYSKDSLSLTIRASWGIQYIKYNLDGTMASFSSPINNLNDTYTYTDDGKIERIDYESNDKKSKSYSMYEYNDNTTITRYRYSEIFDKFLPDYKKVIEYLDNKTVHYEYNYSFDSDKWVENNLSWIEILDSKGRVIETGNYNNKNREYTISGKYEYTKNGYIQYETSDNKNYSIREYTFNDRGDLIKEIWYYKNEDGSKNLYSITDYTYTYPNPTSNERMKQQGYKIHSTENGLIIENNMGNCNIKASIYAITGQLLRTISISDNRTEIPLSSGIYIIVVDNQSYKVKVK